ncbi:MAG: hypothetical protein GKR93_03870 [Gammaproteobacteria bacterium]|nr:hypothetical protein [Gammaproteobacteria bacterium]
MTTPVIQALHREYPSAIKDVVADKRSKDVFINCSYRGDIFYKEKDKFLRGGPALVGRLIRVRYKLIVDLRTDAVEIPTPTFFSVDKPERCLPWGPSPHWLIGENSDARNITVKAAEAKVRKAMSG